MKFVDVKNDVAFRKIFGNEHKTTIIISFLNAVLKLKGSQRIKEVNITNPYQFPRVAGEKASIIDVRAKDIQFTFIELKKFFIDVDDLKSLTEKWVYFIKNAKNLEVIPDNVDDEGLREAYRDADKHSWKKEELIAYDNASIAEQDERGKLKFVIDRTKREIVERCFNKGMKIAVISEITDLPQEQILLIVDEIEEVNNESENR